MKKKSISGLRISEICKTFHIQRTTFYYHFRDKYDLVAWIFTNQADNTNVIDVDSTADVLDSIKEKIAFYKNTYADNSQNALWKYMVDYFVEKYENLAEGK